MHIPIPATAKIISFDVFDTVLTRTVPEPTGIFVLLADFLAKNGIIIKRVLKHDFAQIRIDAERQARRRSIHEEITLDEIYDQFERLTGLPNEVCRKIAAGEVDLELQSARPVPAMVELVDASRIAGRRVAFISDMYLPKAVVESMLKTAGIYRSDDHVYVSADLRMTKRSGKLFHHLIKQEGISTADIFHIGDNPHSDFTVPRRLGIESSLWKHGVPNRYERLLSAGGSDHSFQRIAGACRLARLEQEGYAKPPHSLFRIGANVAGPVLSGYVAWLLRDAASRNIKRLYFVSRDGQVLLDIASRLSASLDIPPIELRYLYGSRQAWHLPATIDLSTELLEWLVLPDPVVTLRILAERLGSDLETVVSLLSSEGFAFSSADTTLAPIRIKELRGVISRGGVLGSFILSQARETRLATLSYFRQEGLFDDVPWAVVDMGWKGHLQDSLRTILNTGGYTRPVEGFYFGLLTRGAASIRKYPYLFGPDLPRILTEQGAACISLLEVFTAADHGMTVGYHADGNGTMRPTFKGNNEYMRAWGIEQLREGIRRFVGRLDEDQVKLMARQSYAQCLCNIMMRIQSDPSREEAECLGTYPFSSNQAETELRSLAPPLSFVDALHYLMLFDGDKRFQLTFWLHGSRKRSAWHVNHFLILCSNLLLRTHALRDALRIRKQGAPV